MSKPWFAPKSYGYGAGLPIAWQGWAVLLSFVVAIVLVMEVPRHFLTPGVAITVSLCGVSVLVALLVVVAKAKTEGGWRWRWGEGP